MENLTIGVHIAAAGTVELVDRVVEAEQVGVEVAWLTVGGLAPDPFAVFAAAAVRTQRIEFGTSIVPTFPRHPLAMAQGAMSVDQLAPGRLRLGVGPSHKPFVEPTWGIPFERPQAHLREYLTILKAGFLFLHTVELYNLRNLPFAQNNVLANPPVFLRILRFFHQ